MKELNLDYEKYGNCSKKDTTYDEKVKIFEDNVKIMMMSSTFIGQISKLNLGDMYELLKNDNILIAHLPIFRYNDRVMCFSKGEINDDYEHGKYKILTTNQIKKYLNENYLIFIYTVFDTEYEESEGLKYRTIILKEELENQLEQLKK